MRHRIIVALIFGLLLAGAAASAVRAEGGADCVRSQCEAKGRTCVEATYTANDACMKAARKTCDSVQPADKFNCLKRELTPCALARNSQQDACLEDVRACHAACGQFSGERTHFWCVGDLGNMTTGAFCEADPTDARLMDECGKLFTLDGQVGSMTCDPL